MWDRGKRGEEPLYQGDNVVSLRTPTGYGDGAKLYVARDRGDSYKNGKKSETASQKATPPIDVEVGFRNGQGGVARI